MKKTIIPNAGQYTITRHLPKTGQTASYFAEDDGEFELGWWRGRLNANNKNRWLQHTIGGDVVVVDRATGLMWPTDCTGVGGNGGVAIAQWVPAIVWAVGLVFAGFTDWRLPNIYELHSILDFGSNPGWHQPPFTNVINNIYWSSTSNPANWFQAMCLRFQLYGGLSYSKTAPGANIYVLGVRDAAI